MLVRAADSADLDDLVRLRAAWRDSDVTSEYMTSFRAWFQQEGATRWWWLAQDEGGSATGMVNVKLFLRMPSPASAPTRWGYLANLFVLPSARGNGIGSDLVRAAVARARVEGLARLVLSPSDRSVTLYGRLGFRSAHELLVHPLQP